MSIKIIKLKDAFQFARDNGYLYAMYEYNSKDENYHLANDSIFSIEDRDSGINNNTEIVAMVKGNYVSYDEFTTKDKQFCFRLHNNWNIPSIIPTIKHLPVKEKLTTT